MKLLGALVVLLALHNSESNQCSSNPPSNGGIQIQAIAQTTFGSDGAHWDRSNGVLYFVDSNDGVLYRYDPGTGSTTSVTIGKEVMTAVEVQNAPNELVVPVGLTFKLIEWDGTSSSISSSTDLFTVNDRTQNKFESAKADINGVLFGGTRGNLSSDAQGREFIQRNLASFYRYEKNTSDLCSVDTIITPISAGDDLAWSPDNKIMYIVDSPTRCVFQFNYDAQMSQPYIVSTLFNVTENGYSDTDTHSVVPISVAVDSNGDVWVPIYGVGDLLHISSGGQLINKYSLPTILITSCVWGGTDLTTLYCTSNKYLLRPEEAASQPDAGAVLEITGLPSRGINGGGYSAVVCDL